MIQIESGLTFGIDQERLASLHFTNGLTLEDYTPSEYRLVQTLESMAQRSPLQVIDQGSDMIVFSNPDLAFVIKFPYQQDAFDIRPHFSRRVTEGFQIGKKNLGGILVPSIDIPVIVMDMDNNQRVIPIIVQQKVKTVAKIMEDISAEDIFGDANIIKQHFIRLTREMWQRGVLDLDPNWEQNYGITPSGNFVLIDVGDLSEHPEDFPYYEGLPRTSLYEQSIKQFFTQENFDQLFGKDLKARAYATAVVI